MRIRLVLSACAAAALLVGAATSQARSVAGALSSCKITQTKSVSGKFPASLRFVNPTGGTVKVYWLGYDGKPVLYKTLAPGKSYIQGTFVSHAWEMLSSSGACVAYKLATAQRYIIKGSCHVTQTHSRPVPGGATIRFVNGTSSPVTLDWLDYKGKAVGYGTLASHAARVQVTSVGHAWKAIADDGSCVGFTVGKLVVVRAH